MVTVYGTLEEFLRLDGGRPHLRVVSDKHHKDTIITRQGLCLYHTTEGFFKLLFKLQNAGYSVSDPLISDSGRYDANVSWVKKEWF